MKRLIVVSNRVPSPDRPPQGGLAVALRSALAARGGIWMGWSGKNSGDDEPGPLLSRSEGEVSYSLTDLSNRDYSEYYLGMANSVLWPLCHYRIDLTSYSRDDAEGYFRVNRLFAQRLAPQIQRDDMIWIQDYHMIPLAAALRALGVKNRIGFFMHIPWPSPDIFLTLPVATKLLEAMSNFDLLGFQTPFDAENFSLCLARSGVAQPIGKGLSVHRTKNRSFEVGAYPISIDTQAFTRTAEHAVRNATMRKFRSSLDERALMIGVDRLDYTKGLAQRISGFGRFLAESPDWMGRVTYLQVTPQTREGVAEYDNLRQEVAGLAGQINGQHGRLDWTPIRYVNRAFSQQTLAAAYRLARVGLVTPMRDGMNLVAKEYVAAQDPQDPGVLVLSRFAGAAAEFGDSALLVNPYDEEAIAHAIRRALTMSSAERMERHSHMIDHLRRHDVFHWSDSYLAALEARPAYHLEDCLA